MGGYTPIANGRNQYQFSGTAGQRFGPEKKLGLLFGGSYDYNARGIDDIEPAFAPPPLVPNTMDLRSYLYDRTRYAFAGGAASKIGVMASGCQGGVFSQLKNLGAQWGAAAGFGNFTLHPAAPTDT